MAKSQPINAPLSAAKSRPLSGWRANWRYYYEMTKPRVVMLYCSPPWWVCVWPRPAGYPPIA